MAVYYWQGGTTSWNTASNWDTVEGGGGANAVPGDGDSAIFSAANNNNCTVDANIVCDSIAFDTGTGDYTASIDFAGFDVTTGTSGSGDFGSRVACTTDMGGGAFVVSGHFTVRDMTVTWGTTTLTLTGAGKNFASSNGSVDAIETWVITGSITCNGPISLFEDLDVSAGSLDLGANRILTCSLNGGVLDNSGTITGTGTSSIKFSESTATIASNTGTISIPLFWYRALAATYALPAGTYNNLQFESDGGAPGCILQPAGNITCQSLILSQRSAGDKLTIDNATNDPDWDISGDVDTTLIQTADLTWTKGTGDITLSGTAAQSIDFDGEAVEAIIFAKSAGTATLTGVLDTVGLSWDNAVDAGILDGNGQNVTIGTSGLVGTNGAGATLTMGTGTWTCSGNWDSADCGTLNYNTSEIVMTGAGTTVDIGTNGCYDLTANGGAVTFSYGSGVSQEVNNILRANAGTLTIGSARTDEIADIQVASGATLDIGTSQYVWTSAITQQDGTLTGTTGQLELRGEHAEGNFDAGTYGCIISLKFIGANTDYVTELETGGTYIFNNDFFIEMGNGDRTVNTNGANITFQADVDLKVGAPAGAVIWNKGIGTITLSGNNNQSIDFVGEAVEDIVVNKTAGDVTMTGAVTTDSFTGTSTGTGDFDPNGQTITTTGNCSWAAAFTFEAGTDTMDGSDWQIGGDFTADGQTLPADSGWDLDVAGVNAVASGTGDVGWCTAGGTEINASAGPWTEAEGNNVNWNFGGAPAGLSIPIAMYHYKQMMGV